MKKYKSVYTFMLSNVSLKIASIGRYEASATSETEYTEMSLVIAAKIIGIIEDFMSK